MVEQQAAPTETQAQPAAGTPAPVVAPAATPAADDAPPVDAQAAEAGDGAEPAEAPKADADPYAALALSEDSLVEPEALDGFKAHAKSLGLSPEQATKALAAEEQRMASVLQQHEAQIDHWHEQLKAQYGASLKEHDRDVTAILQKHGPPGLIELLQDSGYAHHPLVFGLLQSVAAAFSAPKDVVRAPAAPRAPTTEAEQWANDYPKSGPLPSIRRAVAGV